MSIDQRTRRLKDVTPLAVEQVVDEVLPAALHDHGDLATQGAEARQLPPLGLASEGAEITLRIQAGRLVVESGLVHAGVVARLSETALSDLVQDYQSTMGLAMTARVQLESGQMDDWLGWEPVLRALLDGRKVYAPGDVTFRDLAGPPSTSTEFFPSMMIATKSRTSYTKRGFCIFGASLLKLKWPGWPMTSTTTSPAPNPTTAILGGPKTIKARSKRFEC